MERLDVVPRRGRAPLLTVWTFAKASEAPSLTVEAPFVAREADGSRSDAYLALREFFGLPGVRLPASAE